MTAPAAYQTPPSRKYAIELHTRAWPASKAVIVRIWTIAHRTGTRACVGKLHLGRDQFASLAWALYHEGANVRICGDVADPMSGAVAPARRREIDRWSRVLGRQLADDEPVDL